MEEVMTTRLKNFITFFNLEVLPDVEPPILQTIKMCCERFLGDYKSDKQIELLLDSCCDRIRERFNIGNWKDVSIQDRQCASILYYLQLLHCLLTSDESCPETEKTVFKHLDTGLLFGAPVITSCGDLLQESSKILMEWSRRQSLASSNSKQKKQTTSVKHQKPSVEEADMKFEFLGATIITETLPSLEGFKTRYLDTGKPVLLKECMLSWPALEKWKDLDYFVANYGKRSVPVEIGTKYTDEDWTQSIMTLQEFIARYVTEENPEDIAYLAQHTLFDQIPELRRDICVPDYCCLRPGVEDDQDMGGGSDQIQINAWFGPQGTVSPLHYDDKHNILAQVIGTKSVILYPPSDTSFLYPLPGIMSNTSRVDPFSSQETEHPLSASASPRTCRLAPGDMLYIPPRWWHHVTSESISFSVSFWW